MQKVLQFFARHAEKFALGSVIYFFIMPFFVDSFSELVAYTWPTLVVGIAASGIIMMKNSLELQETNQRASFTA